jgi:O-antigen/teichoic acid export membrane protein
MMRIDIKNSVQLARSWLAYAALPAAGIITAPILAHALGPDGRGQLAGVLQPMTLAGAVGALGVPSAVTYYIGQGADTKRVLRFGVATVVGMTVLVCFGLILYSGQISRQLNISRLVILLVWTAFIPSAIISIRRSHLQGMRKYSRLDLERLLGALFRVGAMLILWLTGVRSVAIFATAYMLAGLGASCCLKLPRELYAENPVPRASLSGVAFMRYSLLASFGTIAAAMSARLDQALMPAVVSAAELGYYSIAVSVAEISTIITTVVSRNTLADVSNGVGTDAILKPVLIGAGAQILLIISIVITLPYVVPLVFGSEFEPAINLIKILLLGAFLSYWANIAATVLSGMGRPEFGSAGQAVAALVTAVLFWVSWYHIDGPLAAWISVFSQIGALGVSGPLVIWMHRKHRRLQNPSNVVR